MAATLPATELRVGFSGDVRRVPVHPSDGLEQLQSRIAAAFNLSGPFRMRNFVAEQISSDQDLAAAVAAAQDSADVRGPEVVIEAGEDALLDLERAHEATGALRWSLLKEMLASFKAQISEARLEIRAVQHDNAVLNERLCKESSRRQEGDTSVRRDLAGELEALAVQLRAEFSSLSQNLKQEMQQTRQDAVAGTAGFEASWKIAEERISQQTEDSIERFRRELEQAREHLTMLTKALNKEEETRSLAQDAMGEKLQALEVVDVDIGKKLEDVGAKLKHCVTSAETFSELSSKAAEAAAASVEQLRADLNAQRAAWDESLKGAADASRSEHAKLVSDMNALNEKVAKQEVAGQSAHQSLAVELKSIKTELSEMVSTHREQAEQALVTVEASSDQKLTDMLSKVSSEAQDIAARVVMQTKEELYKVLDERLHAQAVRVEESSKGDKEHLLREFAAFREADTKLALELQAQEQSWQQRLAAESSMRESALSEAKKAQTEHLEKLDKLQQEHLEIRLRDFLDKAEKSARQLLDGECARLLGEFKAQSLHVRQDLLEHTGKLDEMWSSRRLSDHERIEQIDATSKRVTEEIRKALLAQSEFGEALDREQKVLIKSLQEGLEQSMVQTRSVQERLHLRVQGLENNMDKVKGHLPILFAPAAAFR
mmetsp:Transcript_48555/g.89441  ORF Transcript_48555/g.89441 Transcript_48555/m.89441 type:complete len:659 (+) Transcript_48555:37-2013(+)